MPVLLVLVAAAAAVMAILLAVMDPGPQTELGVAPTATARTAAGISLILVPWISPTLIFALISMAKLRKLLQVAAVAAREAGEAAARVVPRGRCP